MADPAQGRPFVFVFVLLFVFVFVFVLVFVFVFVFVIVFVFCEECSRQTMCVCRARYCYTQDRARVR